MRKYILIAGIIFSMLNLAVMPVFAQEKSVSEVAKSTDLAPGAKSAIMIERDTGKVLYQKNADKKLPPASMTKIMTLLLIMEAIDNGKLKLDDTIRVSEHAASMGGSQIFLEPGEEMSVNDLLKGIAMASGNDASVALAEQIAGSEEAFVDMMNKKAKALHLKHTHFENCTGLPVDNHYSTAGDMAIMARELLKYDMITDYTSVYEDYLRKGTEDEFWLVNTNKLVKFYPGVDGLKTGYTNEAKYCLTATAKKKDMRVIAVVMGAKSTKKRNEMVSNMLDYAFSQYATKKLYQKGDKIKTLHFLKGDVKKANIVTSESISTIFKKGNEPKKITTKVNIKKNLSLPMEKGETVGTFIVKKDGKVLSTSPLLIDREVKPASFFTMFKRSLAEMVKNSES